MKHFLNDSYRKAANSHINRILEKQRKTILRSAPLPPFRSVSFASYPLNSELASAIYKKKCESLDIEVNPSSEAKFIRQFESSISNKTLHFSGLGLVSECIPILLSSVGLFSKYFVIDLSANRILSGASTIAEFLSYDPDTIFLDLRSNSIDQASTAKIFEALKRNSHLTSIDLSSNGTNRNRIGLEGCQKMAELLSVNSVLTAINVSMTGVGADGCKVIGAALHSNSSLLSLDISSNHFGTKGAIDFFSSEGSLGALESFNISRNEIGDDGGFHLCRRLAGNSTLNSLDLSENCLGRPFIKCLHESMQTSVISSLNLSHNSINEACASTLVFLIRDCPQLKNLDLSFNQLKDSASKEVFSAVAANDGIRSINLSSSMIGNEGAISCAELIETHKGIKTILLSSNRIGDVGGKRIAEALKKSVSLSKLSLHDNEMKDEAAVALADAIKVNTCLEEVDLNNNEFGIKPFETLKDAIVFHKKIMRDNAEQVANKEIGRLTEREDLLMELRGLIIDETERLEITRADMGDKRKKLEEMKEAHRKTAKEMGAKVDAARAMHEKVSEERRAAMMQLSDLKSKVEAEQSEANRQLNEMITRKRQVASRVERSETKKDDLVLTMNRILDDLNLNFHDLKEQLNSTIAEAKSLKERYLKQERAYEQQMKQ